MMPLFFILNFFIIIILKSLYRLHIKHPSSRLTGLKVDPRSHTGHNKEFGECVK